MHKLLFSLLFFLSVELVANETSSRVEIYASDMTTLGNIVEANNGVSVVYKDYFLSAKRAKYDKTTGDLELFDNIRVNYKGESKILGKYARINIAQKEKLFEPFYMFNKKSKVWMSADRGAMYDNDLDIVDGKVSGCDSIDPLWTMDFSSSDYNAKSKWLNLYNMRLYVYDIPVFYTPYFGYSLDTTRRTGLLKPSVGLSSEEGMFYAQPFYIAESNWWDFEITPQIRTNRGYGAYATFRFVDSKNSKGEFRFGQFKEKESYQEEYKETNTFLNDNFYGYRLLYDNSDIINHWFGLDTKGQSGLYVDLNYMNDVEYINVEKNNPRETQTASQVLSRVNFFYNTDDYYLGTYVKYYQNLDLENDDKTIQQLPVIQFHHYIETSLEDHLIYSLDINSKNLTRKVGKKVLQTTVNLPVTLQTSLFDEYINLSYKANLYAQTSQFSGEEVIPTSSDEYDDGYILKNYHLFSISSELTKAFEDFTHVVAFGASYKKDGGKLESGYYEGKAETCINTSDAECEFYQISGVEDTVTLDFIQYVYGSDAKEILFHRLSQAIYTEYTTTAQKYGELENELDYAITDEIHFYNNMFYNFDESLFSKVVNKLSYDNDSLKISLSYLYRDNFLKNYTTRSERYSRYVTSSLDYKYDKHYSLMARYDYDIETEIVKTQEYGFNYSKRCWDFGLRYSENNRPVSGAEPVRDRYVMLNIVLKPFMQPNPNGALVQYKIPN